MILMCIWFRWLKTWEKCGTGGWCVWWECLVDLRLHAMIFCTINDFLANGNLSGHNVKGHHTCPICEKDTSYIQLKHGKKIVYTRHRRFLKPYHQYRWLKKAFNGSQQIQSAPTSLAVQEVFDRVKDIINIFGKTQKKDASKKNIWKKRSIFFDLPY